MVASYSLGGTDLGNVQTERHRKDSQLFTMPMPKHDSDELVAIDLFGTTRNITVEGVLVGTTDAIKTFIAAMEGYVSGDQVTRSYVTATTTKGSYTVMVQYFDWTYELANINSLKYTLELIECASVV